MFCGAVLVACRGACGPVVVRVGQSQMVFVLGGSRASEPRFERHGDPLRAVELDGYGHLVGENHRSRTVGRCSGLLADDFADGGPGRSAVRRTEQRRARIARRGVRIREIDVYLSARKLEGRRLPGSAAVDDLSCAPGFSVIGRTAHHDAVVQRVEPVSLVEAERGESKNVSVVEHYGIGRREKHTVIDIAFVLLHVRLGEELFVGVLPRDEIPAEGVIDIVGRGSLLVDKQESVVFELLDAGVAGVHGRKQGLFQLHERAEIHFERTALPLRGVRIEVSLRRVQVVDRGDLRIDGHGIAAARTRFGIGVLVSRRLGAGGRREGQRQQQEAGYVVSKIHIRWN